MPVLRAGSAVVCHRHYAICEAPPVRTAVVVPPDIHIGVRVNWVMRRIVLAHSGLPVHYFVSAASP